MIDLHCHFLPGIDDGARDLVDAVELARAAAADGIRYAVMTPHIHPGRYDNTRTSIERAYRRFRDIVRRLDFSLEIGMAAEVRLSPDILPLIADDEVPFLGEIDGHRVLLLEFPHSHIPPGADKLVERLLAQNIRPLIAHPERNKDVMRKLAKIEPFVDMGCYLQITASAVSGNFGPAASRRARELLEFDVFKVIASDAHNLKGRRPGLSEGLKAAAKVVGREAAQDLVYKNPLAILHPKVAAVA